MKKDFLPRCPEMDELIASFDKAIEELTDEEFAVIMAHSQDCPICTEADEKLDRFLHENREKLKQVLFPH